MTRLLAIFGALLCFGMIFPMVATDPVRRDLDPKMVIIHFASEVILIVSCLIYCGFAALHSVSHVGNANDRIGWIMLTLGFNIVGSLIYYLTKYQDFRAYKLGGLFQAGKSREHSFFRATPSELNTEPVSEGSRQ